MRHVSRRLFRRRGVDESRSIETPVESYRLVTAVDHTVYGVSAEEAIALDAVTGDEMWSRERPGLADTAPALVDGTVYADAQGFSSVLEAGNGEERWTAELDWLTNSPALANGTLDAGVEPGGALDDHFDETGSRIVAIDASFGEDLWTFDAQLLADLGIGDRRRCRLRGQPGRRRTRRRRGVKRLPTAIPTGFVVR